MPRFTTLPPSEVHVGRGAIARASLEPFKVALGEMEAGRIDLERGEKPGTVRRLLHAAAHAHGLMARCSVIEDGHAIVFKTYPQVRRVSRLADCRTDPGVIAP